MQYTFGKTIPMHWWKRHTITVGASPHGVRVSPDGTQVWVANLKGGTVAVIDTQTRKQIAHISVSLWAGRQHTACATDTEPGAVDERPH